jgi:2,3-bisphosphoglycerate-independent phosphoglycerate mutase
MPKKSGKTLKPRAKTSKSPVVLVILDGWGNAPPGRFNSISLARKPNFDNLSKEYGAAEICASGTCVGLTEGQMGNSEVGHLTIGAGRIIFQDLMRVFEEINSGKLSKNPKLVRALTRLRKRGTGTLHFLGLLSDGGVHSHIDHLFALLKIARDLGIQKIVVHAFLDGRDTPPRSGVDHLAALTSYLNDFQEAYIATVSGRYYAMDRDNRWERTKLSYDAIVYAEGEKFEDAVASVKQSYQRGESDEFVIPIVNSRYGGMNEGDLAIFFNFRPDRARQLTKALTMSTKEFGNLFDRREDRHPELELVTMTVYDEQLKRPIALIGREKVRDTLSNVLEKENLRQLRVAETEKYAHVTYFFNGLVEKPRKLEDRILIPSQKVETYDKSPAMSAEEIAENAVRAIGSSRYGFMLVNFANADMVGHSGLVEPTVKGVETVDQCLGRILEAWKAKRDKLSLIITADHGNAEKMFDPRTGQPHTAHTSSPVPLILISEKWKLEIPEGYKGGLQDISPTILEIMKLNKPRAMTGRSLAKMR